MRLDQFDVSCAADRGHRCSVCPCDLDREGTDAARCTVDQDRLPTMNVCLVSQTLKCCYASHRQSRSLFKRQRSMQDTEFAAKFRSVRVQPKGPTVIALQRAIACGEVDPTLDLNLAMHLIQGPFMSKRTVENEELTDEEIETVLGQIVQALTI
jgi:Tetracyclin repressor-like, C-terminal domain